MDLNGAGFEVDVFDSEAGDFGDAQAGIEEEEEKGAVAGGLAGFGEFLDFFGGEGVDRRGGGFGHGDCIGAGKVEFLRCPVEVRTDDFPVGLDGGFGAVVLAEMFEEGDDVGLGDLVDEGVMEEGGEGGEGGEIGFDGYGGIGIGNEIELEALKGMDEGKHRDVVSFW